ncbi:hypothetical protein SAMN03159353_1002105 [Cedecea sp. NFIX57]|nr:hypothetical protein SAMN03159353_1002105 [Cedecea sp. NFIX57]
MSGAIFGQQLEYTHTPKGLPLNCQRWQGIRGDRQQVPQGCDKSRYFFARRLLTKNEGEFLPAGEIDYPLIYIN